MIDHKIPILCYVTDRRSLSVPSAAAGVLAEKIGEIAAAGIDWVQIREKDLSAQELAALTRKAISRRSSARIIVNDRADVATTEGAGGVHLGESSLPVTEVAKWVKRSKSGVVVNDHGVASQLPVEASGDFLIGASCHSLKGAKAAARDGADYIFFGPVFATPSKAKFGEPQGVQMLAAVCSAVPVPVIAIGGITLENSGECIAAGASGIAAIRLFQDAAVPAQVVSALRKLRR
ncbi:MAG TPA: thiamine phosphate synthase [Candidatus Acidoferrum sp.]